MPKLAAAARRSTPRRLTAAELRAVEREKVRLSIELHDGVGQHLTGIAFLAKALANQLRASGAAEAPSAEQIAQLTNEAISSIRALARGLRPVGSEDNALIVALAQLARDIHMVYGIECRYGADENATIASALVSHHLYRIAQEAVHNAVKHGGKGRIGIDLAVRGDQLVLTVTNPGRLPDLKVDTSRSEQGIGMVSMRYRATLIGARMSLENYRAHDVRLRVTVNRSSAQTLKEEGTFDMNSQASTIGPLPAKSRIMIVDDHIIVRQGIAQLVNREPDLDVRYEAGDADSALALLNAEPVDLAIVDISLPGTSGLELVKMMHTQKPNLPILMMSMHDEALYSDRAFRAGAKGYVMKQEATERLLMAIRKILNGGVYVSDRMQTVMVQRFLSSGMDQKVSFIDNLTDREFEILRMIGQGLTVSEIAAKLGRSVKTVEAHRANLREKLGLKRAAELARFATQWAERGN